MARENEKGEGNIKNDYDIRGEVTVIFVRYQGQLLEALIDSTNLAKVKEFTGTWYGWKCPKTHGIYVCGQKTIGGHRTSFRLHRWITDAPDDKQVDHINHNPLDNRQSVNLRIVTNAQNSQNLKGPKKNNKSGHLNVHYDISRDKWAVSFTLNRNKVFFKRFASKREAIRVAKVKRAEIMEFSEECI